MSEIASPAQAVAQHRARPLPASEIISKVITYVLLTLLSLTFLMPFLWMVSTSFKDTEQTYHVPPIWIPYPLRLQNYPEAMQAQPFATFFGNTLQYAVFATVGTVLSAALVAYGFARIRWRGREVFFFICICTMMIPFQVKMIPLYLTFRTFHWLNSYKPLIVPAFFGNAYSIFLLRQFFMTLPAELSDAARIDGANELSIFARIILPLARPALAVVGLFAFIGAWNDYIGPLIYLNQPDKFPISLGLQQFQGQFVEKLAWPYLMAASTVTILPIVILFFFAQRTFIEGIAISGIKG